MEERIDFYKDKWVTETKLLSFKYPETSRTIVLACVIVKTVDLKIFREKDIICKSIFKSLFEV